MGFDEEQESFDAREADTGIPVLRKKIQVSVPNPEDPDGNPLTRFYDGLEEVTPGQYRGLKHKAGGATLTPGQKLFDGLVNSGMPAKGILDGEPIEIVEAEEVRPAVLPAPALPALPATPTPLPPPPVLPAPPGPPPAPAPVPVAPPVALPAPAPLPVPLPATPAPVVVTPPDPGIAWGAMFHDYAQSFYGPIVVVGGGLAAIGGFLVYPFASPGLGGG